MKFIHIIVLCCISTPFVFSQTSDLLEKYRIMALEYNPDLKAAEKNISASMEMEQAARADLKPKLSANADFRYTGNPMELTLDLPSMERPLTFQGRDLKYGASVTLLQPVYTGGRLLETIRMAGHQQSIASHQAEIFRSSICYQTDMQYWNTVARREIVEITADFRNSMRSFVHTIRERVDAGLVDPQDLLMAEVKLNEAEYLLLQTQTQFETSRMGLNSLIGVELVQPTEIDTCIPPVAYTTSTPLPGGENRAELKMAYEQKKLAESSLKLNDSKYKPQVYVGVDGSYSSPGYNFRSDLDPNYAVYAKVSIPLFEWGKRKSEKRAYSQRIGMATDQINKVEDQVQLEIQTAQVSLTKAMEQVCLSENSLQKASENEQKALERYTEGKISVVEVIDAQAYRQTAQLNYVQAKVLAQGAYSDLIKALNAYE